MEQIKTPLSLENLSSSLDEPSPLKFRSSHYKFLQSFGEKRVYDSSKEEDLITSLSFDHSGDNLAVGDRCGRIVVFKMVPRNQELDETISDHFSSFLTGQQSGRETTCGKKFSECFEFEDMDFEYEYSTDFQAQKPDVDFLKNKEISPQIGSISWLEANGSEMRMLVSSSKCVSLWKVSKNRVSELYNAREQQSYYKFHDYAINSLSVQSNEQYFLSSDDLKINLWDLNEPNKTYNLVDLSPFDLEDLSEVITGCRFHPKHDNIFVFGSSEGTIRIGDLRKSGVCDKACQTLRPSSMLYKDFKEYAAIIRSLSDCRYLQEDHQIVARDYLNVFLWDDRNAKTPVQITPVYQPIKSRLKTLLKNEQIFDQFSIAVDPSQRKILTGNYNESFHLIDLDGQSNWKYKIEENDVSCVDELHDEKNLKGWNYDNKILKADFHPKQKCLAVACQNCLYLCKK